MLTTVYNNMYASDRTNTRRLLMDGCNFVFFCVFARTNDFKLVQIERPFVQRANDSRRGVYRTTHTPRVLRWSRRSASDPNVEVRLALSAQERQQQSTRAHPTARGNRATARGAPTAMKFLSAVAAICSLLPTVRHSSSILV